MFSKLQKSLARITARKQFNDSRSKTAFSSAPVKLTREKICKFCGKPFTPNTPKQIFCSYECSHNSRYKNHGKVFEKECAICGKTFTDKNPNRKYCSEQCKLVAHKKRTAEYGKKRAEQLKRLKELKKKPCKHCGKNFVPKLRRQKFCSAECRKNFFRLQKREPVEKTCIFCGKKFLTTLPHKIYCSNNCSKKHFYESRRRKPIEKFCKNCGKLIPNATNSRVFCSNSCRQAFHRKQIPRQKKPCLHCGKNFFCDPDEVRYFCSKKCRKAHTRNAAFSSTSKKPKKSLEQWQKEAAQCGMTYGQYRTAVERFGKTFDELKLPPPAPREEENIIEIKL